MKTYNVKYTIMKDNAVLSTESFYNLENVWEGFGEIREYAEKMEATIYRDVEVIDTWHHVYRGGCFFDVK